jgi:protein tyrosine phosphatase (PTP) superfamily phosphohydrolase (DUF442 family)
MSPSRYTRGVTVGAASVLLVAATATLVGLPGCRNRACERPPACCAPTVTPPPTPPPSGPTTAAAPGTASPEPPAIPVAPHAPAAPHASATAAKHDDHHAVDPTLSPADQRAAKTIHSYVRVSPRIASGASPETDEDFAALAATGVKSIVSVDGAKPPVELAKKHGIRYVHLPIGYDGITEGRALELAKAFDVLGKDGPVFVHCHHGKHRGPAACSIAQFVLEGATNADTVAYMKKAGTNPKYKGLYEFASAYRPPTREELDALPVYLPEAAPTSGLQDAMVKVDFHWENLKAAKKAKWGPPADNPDVDPPHEATMLAEQYREIARLPEVAKEPQSFHDELARSEAAAWALSKALTRGALDAAAATKAFESGEASCTACHTGFRDNTHRR